MTLLWTEILIELVVNIHEWLLSLTRLDNEVRIRNVLLWLNLVLLFLKRRRLKIVVVRVDTACRLLLNSLSTDPLPWSCDGPLLGLLPLIPPQSYDELISTANLLDLFVLQQLQAGLVGHVLMVERSLRGLVEGAPEIGLAGIVD